MLSVSHPGPQVVAHAATGRPREIRHGRRRLPVTTLEAVRDERAAYAAATGPRTVFVVRAGSRRFRLVHLLREQRWTVEELASGQGGLAPAA